MNTKPPDPIFAVIEAHRVARKLLSEQRGALDYAIDEARKKLGPRPSESVSWRGYACGAEELKMTRAEARALPNADRRAIALEYRAALATLRKQIAAGLIWDRRAGIGALRRSLKAAGAAESKAGLRMAWTKPRTMAGAHALLEVTLEDLTAGMVEWHPSMMARANALLKQTLAEIEAGEEVEWPAIALANVLATLGKLAKGGAA